MKAGSPSCWYSNSWAMASLWSGLRLSLARSLRSASATEVTPWSSLRLVSALSLSVGPSYRGRAVVTVGGAPVKVVWKVLVVVVEVDGVVVVVVVVVEVVVVVVVVVVDG